MPQLKIWDGSSWGYVSKGKKGDTGSMYIDQSGGTSDTYGVLSGTLNSSNKTFTVSQGIYSTGSLMVYLNGQLQTQGTAQDWVETTPASGVFDFITAPDAVDEITVAYFVSQVVSSSFVYSEVPSGTVNGTNDDFVFANTIATGTLLLFRNGLLQKITEDYTLSGATVTFVTPPAVSSIILGSYQLSVTPVGNADTLDGLHASEILDPVKTGWNAISGTFTYASATTINVSSGAAAIYSVGDKLRFQNNDSGTYLYGYIITIADTLLTIVGNAVPNATLTDAYYSKIASPLNFPHWFALGTPTWTTSGTPFTNQPTGNAFRFSIVGRNCYVDGGATCHATSGGTGIFYITFPAGSLPATWTTPTAGTSINANSSVLGWAYVPTSGSVILIAQYDGNTLATNSQIMIVTVNYLF